MNARNDTSNTRFEVWAPTANQVELVYHPEAGAGDEPMTASMEAAADGWWQVDTGTPVARYSFNVDGEGPFADPRSRRQPEGVHGLSAPFDPGTHRWADAAWTGRALPGGSIYELHIGTFTPEGTLDSAIDRLDHLVSLGVDFVEVLPVNAFNGTHNWGYDGVLWYAVHEAYGGPAAYQRFVDACHAAGLGVIQDVVYNHLGPSGNVLPRFGPYLSTGSANTWGDSVNLDGEHSDEVRRYIIDNALMWLRDYHVDGLRLDAVHALVDHRAVHVLEELAIEVEALAAHTRRPLTLIAESDLNNPRLITERAGGGYGLDGQWSDDFHHAVHVALTGETTGYYADFAPLAALSKVLTRGFFHDGTYSSFRGRNHGAPIDLARTPGWRLVVANQNHDQIGNRAIGDRLTASLNDGQLAIAATLTLLGPFTPMLFMGEEWGATTPWQFFTSHPEPELGEATATGRIEEFSRMGWDPAVVPDPQDPATFTRSKLRWEELDEPRHAALLSAYRRLTALRRRHPQFTDPRLTRCRVWHDEDARLLRLDRDEASIVINFSADAHSLARPDGETLFSYTPGGEPVPETGRNDLELPGHSVTVFLAGTAGRDSRE